MDPSDDAFRREARSAVRALNDGLLAVERDADAATVDDLFRVAHSLKGTCRTVGLDDAGDLAHAIEDVLDGFRTGEVAPAPDLVDEALAALDLLEASVEAGATGGTVAGDVDATLDALRDALDARREDAPEGATTAGSRPGEPRPGDDRDLPDGELSDEVRAALEDASEFDDVDALLAEMDAPAEDDRLTGWGLLDGEESLAPASSANDGDGDGDPPATGDGEFPEDPAAVFEAAKERVDDDRSIDALQADIDDVAFGEFDDEDVYTIEELVDLGTGGESADGESAEGADEEPVEVPDEGPTGTPDAEPTEAEKPDDGADGTGGFVYDHVTEPDAGSGAAVEADDGAVEAAGEDAEPDALPDLDGVPDLRSIPDADPEPGSESEPEPDAVPDPDSVPDADLGVDLDAAFDPEAELDVDLDADASVDAGAEPGAIDGDDLGLDVAVDEEMAAFESRFRDLFGGAEEVPGPHGSPFRAAASTIEESRLDAGRFPTAADGDESAVTAVDRSRSMTVGVDTADRLLAATEELSLTHRRLEEAVGPATDDAVREAVADLLGVVTEFDRAVRNVRLMPLEAAVEAVPRTVRDVARSQGKEVDLVVETAGVELDRGIVDRLGEPLVHLARNAVDHGIEEPAGREAAGKPPEGTVELRAERVGNEVVVELSDDGRGVDLVELRRRAVEGGRLTTAEATALSDRETYDLLLEPGFTTREEVTDVSGRGVGMDVVNRTVTDLGGSVAIDSDPGEGTTVRLTVPVSVALTEVLFVEAGAETYGVPVAVVEQVTAAPPAETVDGRDVVRRSGLDLAPRPPEEAELEDAYPLVRLRSALGVPGSDAGSTDDDRLVWVRTESERLAVRCDRVLASEEVVVRPYDDVLRDVPGVGGATTLGDGSAVNVLDAGSI